MNKGDRRKCKCSTRLGKTVRITIAAFNVIHMEVTIGKFWCPFLYTTVHFKTRYTTSSEGRKRISKYIYYVCVCICIYMYACMYVYIYTHTRIYIHIYSVIQKDRLNFVRLYFLNYISMWMIYITFERGGPKFSNTTARALA